MRWKFCPEIPVLLVSSADRGPGFGTHFGPRSRRFTQVSYDLAQLRLSLSVTYQRMLMLLGLGGSSGGLIRQREMLLHPEERTRWTAPVARHVAVAHTRTVASTT